MGKRSTAYFVGGAVFQYMRPASDIATNGWTPSTGTDAFAVLDEVTVDTTDYDYSPNNPTTSQYLEVKLSSASTPIAGTQTLGYVLRARGQMTHFVVTVRQGASLIQTFTHDLAVADGWQTFSQSVTGLSDYTDVRVRITSSAP